jgi:hypothetical protein
MDDVYSKEIIQLEDLRRMQEKALELFKSCAYIKEFQHLLIAVTLCQGGANHYAVTEGEAKRYLDEDKKGLKDIDIWFFFERDKDLRFFPRWKKNTDFGASKFGKNPGDKKYIGRRIDFLGRSINKKHEEPEKNILTWLESGRGESPRLLAKKAIVGLYPKSLFNKFIWVNPDLKHKG